MSKKKIVTVCLVVALLATGLIGGSLAYFTDKDEANNVFTMGNVDITLDEADVEKSGDEWTAGEVRVKENTYEGVYPGAVLPKDPTIHNVGSYDAYVRAKVTVNFNKLAGMQADKELFNGATADEDLTNIVNISEDWTYAGRSIDFKARTVTYTYTYNTVLAADADTTPLFTEVTVPGFVTNEDVAEYGLDEFNLDIVGEAIQTLGFDSADEAWEAFDAE